MMNISKNNTTVFVGISGGVDSSVSAALLKEATPKNFQRLFGRPTPKGFRGYNVVGVFIRTWTPDFIDCTWRDERRDAMRVCAHLGIPFLECDAEEAYKKGVAEYMIDEYKKGRTPNPDVMCNREVKFGVFWDFAKKHGADFIATGHYAVNDLLHTDRSVLCKSPDLSKDQSYFLWTLRQEDLEHILFPVGHLNKTDVRKLAKKYKIPVAEKKDSQGVCFLGPLDMKDFLRHYIKSEKGDVLLMNQDNDLGNESEIIGSHDGAVFFTIGERHGFNITKNTAQDKPYYVVAKDIDKNTITVSHKSDLWQPTSRSSGNNGGSIINLTNTNWITKPEMNKDYKCQIRYHGELLDCKIKPDTNTTCIEAVFVKNVLVDSGQSIVFYDGDVCLGGGVVR